MIPVVRIIIPVVGVIIQKGTSKKEIAIVPEMISVFEVISVLEMPSSVFRKAMAKTTSGKPSEMATAAETATINQKRRIFEGTLADDLRDTLG